MAGAMPAVSSIGGLVSAGGSLLKGRMTANTLNAQAEMQRVQAEEALQAGQYNAFRQELVAKQALGRAAAAYGAAGITSGSTSAQSVLMAGAMNAELDRQNIIHGSEINAINHENQASLDEFGGNSALEGSYFSAIGSVLGGSSSLAGGILTSGTGSENPTSMTSADLTSSENDALKTNLNRLNPSLLGEQEGLGM